MVSGRNVACRISGTSSVAATGCVVSTALMLVVLLLIHLWAGHQIEVGVAGGESSCSHEPAHSVVCSSEAVATAAASPAKTRRTLDRVVDLSLMALILAAAVGAARRLDRHDGCHRGNYSGRARLLLLRVARC